MSSNTIFRSGTATTYDNALRNLSARQTSLSNLQENLTSGKRVTRASDDPVSASLAERALTRISRIQTEQRALEAQRSTAALAESAMGDAVNLVQEARDLMVQAGSGVTSAADRRTIASQIQVLRDQLMEVANRKDANGLPLMASLGSAENPFAQPLTSTGTYTFQGLPGQASGGTVSLPTTLDGDAAFMLQPKRDGAYHASLSNVSPPTSLVGSSAIRSTDPTQVELAPGTANAYEYKVNVSYSAGASANTISTQYTITSVPAGASSDGATITVPDFPASQSANILVTQIPGIEFRLTGTPKAGDSMTLQLSPSTSVFDVLDKAVSELNSATTSGAAAHAVGQALANMDRGLERLQGVRSFAGELLNRADKIAGNQDARSTQLEADRSRAEDLDMMKGISDFQNQQTGYQAALQSYAQVQKLSLFNYIG